MNTNQTDDINFQKTRPAEPRLTCTQRLLNCFTCPKRHDYHFKPATQEEGERKRKLLEQKGPQKSELEREKESLQKMRKHWIAMKIFFINEYQVKRNHPRAKQRIRGVEEFLEEIIQREDELNTLGENAPKRKRKVQQFFEELAQRKKEQNCMEEDTQFQESDGHLREFLEEMYQKENLGKGQLNMTVSKLIAKKRRESHPTK